MRKQTEMRRCLALCAMAAAGLAAPRAEAVNVVLDYSNGIFFYGDATAKAAVDKAAQDISTALTTSLAQVAPSNSATVNQSTATFSGYFSYTNPYTNAPATYSPPASVLPANEVRIFVGTQNLAGNVLGQGGSGVSAAVNVSFNNATDRDAAVDQAAALATTNLKRGGGPIIGTVTGAVAGHAYSVSAGVTVGNLWFDSDTNNDGATDNATTLSNFYQYDANAPVTAGKNDLYSVALHEILHAMGIGGSQSWNSRVSGADTKDWTGPAVIALLGTGDNVLEADSKHIAEGTLSRRITDFATQEAVMDPSITTGTRKLLTELDLAFLRDINWSTAVVPEPASLLLLGCAPAVVLLRRRRV